MLRPMFKSIPDPVVVYSRGGTAFWCGEQRDADKASLVTFEDTRGTAVVTPVKLK